FAPLVVQRLPLIKGMLRQSADRGGGKQQYLLHGNARRMPGKLMSRNCKPEKAKRICATLKKHFQIRRRPEISIDRPSMAYGRKFTKITFNGTVNSKPSNFWGALGLSTG